MGAEFVELANTQYYAWALHNREQLMPSKIQLFEAERATNTFRTHHTGQMKVFFVAPDYYEDRPKKCCNGWGTTFLTVTPNGEVLPCQSAKVISHLTFPNVRESTLHEIWQNSTLFNQYRGFEWMQEPCKSCHENEKDVGGCRCQAFLLTGDASNTDPVCSLSPLHHLVTDVISVDNTISNSEIKPLLFRNTQNAKKFIT